MGLMDMVGGLVEFGGSTMWVDAIWWLNELISWTLRFAEAVVVKRLMRF